MKKEYLLFTPGPTLTSQMTKDILHSEVLHHRSSTFQTKFASLETNLKKVVHNENANVCILTSSGTGAMEATVVNFVNSNDKIVVLDTGFFAKRYANICKVYNKNVTVVDNFDDFVNHTKSGSFDVAVITHHETTTGQLNDIEQVGKVKHQNTLLMVDCISSMIVHEIEMEKWNIDVVCSSSQKGFDVCPGLAFVLFNNNAHSRMEKSDLPKYYFDFNSILTSAKKHQPFTTMPANILWALDESIKEILENGLEQNYKKFEQRKKVALEAMRENNLELNITSDINYGNVVLPIKVDFEPDFVVQQVWDKYKIQLINGYGAPCVRLGLIGDFTLEELQYAIKCLAKTLEELKNEN